MKKIFWFIIRASTSAMALIALFAVSSIAVPLPGGTLDPLSIPKYVQPLVIPPVMPMSTSSPAPAADYDIAVRQFQQQILPGGVWNEVTGRNDAFAPTTLWSYGRAEDAISLDFVAPVPLDPNSPFMIDGQGASFNYPSFTIETMSQADTTTPTKIRWINDLVNPETRDYLPHLFAVDQTLHWANPAQDICRDGTNRTDCATFNPAPYNGPVPLVTHVHGAHVNPESDGYPEAWWMPAADNIPANYANNGTIFTQYDDNNMVAGSAFYAYENDQPAATLWYHDHALGMTRLNVYAGPAGFYLIRGGAFDGAMDGRTMQAANLPGPAPVVGGDPNFDSEYRATIREVPVVIQDRSFNDDGSLFYPDSRAFFDGYQGPYTPNDSDIAPIWNPEAFFNTMVVNGTTWPTYTVAPERYRVRLLNGCNSRFLNLAMYKVDKKKNRGNRANKYRRGHEVPFFQIGGDQGFLPQVAMISTGFHTPLAGDGTIPNRKMRAPAKSQALLMAPAERADVIIDFSQFKPGTVIRMINTGPDGPFAGLPDVAADPSTSGQIMEFVVGPATGMPDPSTPVQYLVLNNEPSADLTQPAANQSRRVSLNEGGSEQVCVSVDPEGVITVEQTFATPQENLEAVCAASGWVPMAPKEALLGEVIVDPNNPAALAGLPLHWMAPISENPQVGDEETWEIFNFTADAHPIHLHLVRFQLEGRQAQDPVTAQPVGDVTPALPNEAGWKDTVIAYPGEVTRIRATFDKEGLYVWHCHIVEHEDSEMMRPYFVGDLNNRPVGVP